MTNYSSKPGYSMDEYNPWVISVGSAAKHGQVRHTLPGDAVPDPKPGRRIGQTGILQRFRLMLQRA